MKKQYITADQLLVDSFTLAFNIIDSGYRPDLIAGIWRGGTPVGSAVQEVFEFAGINTDHVAIRTSSYTSIGERTNVTVHGLEYLERYLTPEDKLLLVDDVFDTGHSVDTVIAELQNLYRNGAPECRVATPYFKPNNNETSRVPDYMLYETDDWLVFPHELIGLGDDEIADEKPLPQNIKDRLLALHNASAED